MPMADHLPGLDPQVDVALPRRLNESTPQGVVASDIAGIPASFSDGVVYHRRQLRYEEACVGATAAVKSHVLVVPGPAPWKACGIQVVTKNDHLVFEVCSRCKTQARRRDFTGAKRGVLLDV